MGIEIIIPDEYPKRRNFLDQETRKKLPEIFSQVEESLEAKALIKFYSPDKDWAWYATEFDGNDTLYGLVVNQDIELALFSLSQLEMAESMIRLSIERDFTFEAKSLRELADLHWHQRIEFNGIKDGPFERIKLFAKQISSWNQGIVEIIGIGNLNKEVLEPDDLVELICVYDIEPDDENKGELYMMTLRMLNELECASGLLGITNSIELGFEMKGTFYLTNGKILNKPETQISVWQQTH